MRGVALRHAAPAHELQNCPVIATLPGPTRNPVCGCASPPPLPSSTNSTTDVTAAAPARLHETTASVSKVLMWPSSMRLLICAVVHLSSGHACLTSDAAALDARCMPMAVPAN